MKIALIVLGIIALLMVVFQIYTTMATNKSEKQPYEVIQKEEGFEIRYNPSATMATINSSAKTFKELGSSSFVKLASYIFGGNKDKEQIAMTSPVHMEIGDTSACMSFVMPSNYTKDNLPIPNNADVTIQTTPNEYVAAISFGGFASQEDIDLHIHLLEIALKKKQIQYHGRFRFLGYNSPYQLFGRINEIIVAIDWDK